MSEVLGRILFYAGCLLLLSLLKVITTFLHELGHAVTSVLLTRSKATMYVGSYGDPRNSIQFRSTWIDIWFRYNPFRWNGGLCISGDYAVSWKRQALIVLAGPLMTVVIGVAASYLAFMLELHESWKLFFAAILVFAILDLIVNLTPIKRSARMYNGSIAYSDGYLLLYLIRNRNFAAEWGEAINHLNGGEYIKAGVMLEGMLRRGIENRDVCRYAIAGYMWGQDLHKAYELVQIFEEKYEMEPEDFSTFGAIKSQIGLYDEGLADYEQALLDDPGNCNALNNLGFTLNLLERYDEAIPHFDRALELDPKLAYSYNNRGLAKIKLGRVEEGLADIRYSLELDENNSYAHRNLGIYHFDRNEFAAALQLFEKSRELDSTTHLIDHYIDLAQQQMPRTSS